MLTSTPKVPWATNQELRLLPPAIPDTDEDGKALPFSSSIFTPKDPEPDELYTLCYPVPDIWILDGASSLKLLK